MSALPNPFEAFARVSDATPAEPAVVSLSAPVHDTAADCRFVLDVDRFMAELEPLPIFLSPDRCKDGCTCADNERCFTFLHPQGPVYADDLMPVLAVLAGY